MTNGEAVNWIINISADIGKIEHQDLWHYEQALSEIRELLESAQPERKPGRWLPVDEQPYFRKHFHRVYCSRCQKEGRETWDYCPSCGAKMEVGHDSD